MKIGVPVFVDLHVFSIIRVQSVPAVLDFRPPFEIAFIILERNSIDEGFDGKILRFKENNRYAIEPFIDRRVT